MRRVLPRSHLICNKQFNAPGPSSQLSQPLRPWQHFNSESPGSGSRSSFPINVENVCYSLVVVEVSPMFQAGGHVAGTSCPERAVCEASWAIESERMVRGSPGGSPSWMMGMVRRSPGGPSEESPGSPSGKGFRGDSMTEIQGLTKAITEVTVQT